jgi:hypothetical protein
MIFRVVTLISFGMIGGWLGWMANDRQIPVRYYSTEVINTPKPGQALRVKSVVWRDKSCYTSVYRLIFDDEGHRHVVNDLEFPAGVLPLGNDTFVAPVPISAEASDGPGIYRVVRKYRCNLLQWIWPIEDGPHDVQFTIAPR